LGKRSEIGAQPVRSEKPCGCDHGNRDHDQCSRADRQHRTHRLKIDEDPRGQRLGNPRTVVSLGNHTGSFVFDSSSEARIL